MTNEEIIEELSSRKVSMSMCISVDDYMKSNIAIEKAVEALKENERLASDNAWLVLNKSEKEFEIVDLLQENTKLKSEIEQLLKNRDADRKYYSNEIQSLIKNQKYEVEKLKGELKSEREWRHNTRIELLDRNKEIESLKEENAELKKEIIKKQLL